MVEYYAVAIATAITTKKLIHDYSIWYGICKVPFFTSYHWTTTNLNNNNNSYRKWRPNQ